MNKPVILFHQYSFKYHSQAEPSLIDINLTINEGEKVLILGPSGSGKSTLAHCINGLIPFSYEGDSSGQLLINDKPVNELDIFTLSQMVGTVLQDTDGQFVGLSVGEDIAFSLENECVSQAAMKKIVQQTAQIVEVEEHIDYSIHALSGGLKQRVSLGGVMVDEEVGILLFDEPLASLDPATGQYTMDLIDRIQKDQNKTVIMIEHRLEDALQLSFDRIIVMDQGRIFSDTTPSQLLVSQTLDQVHIREPLYIKALKYSGAVLQNDQRLEQINNLQLSEENKKQLIHWIQNYKKDNHNQVESSLLQVNQLSFAYLTSTTLKRISFSIKKGEMISLVGKNGAGKSTLAKVISGFEKQDQGEILLNNEPIHKQTIFERANRIGFVMQNPNHMISKHLIFDEVALGLRLRHVPEDEVKHRVEETLKICGLYALRNWPIDALSFGQKKRVTIAAILVLNPEILILDEPTAGQDLRHFTEIMDFLNQLNKQGMTILLVTHDMHVMLEYTTRALVMVDGQVVADQPPVDVLTDRALIEKAHLKRTSLFDLALKAGIGDYKKFIEHFISQDRKARKTWQQIF
ncbi:ABC transporter ATP-binding protein [Paraliobacillus sp. JSM ZJ581]|uniref:ABC transporter ATP-binding protein n=1 Tax=Paraliobacillus sp. JSM ZJ581 TaxID=3342118 RepID=UPI0035A9648F